MSKSEIMNNDLVTLRVDEAIADVVSDVYDVAQETVQQVVTVTKNNPLLIVGALVIGVGIGGFLGYKLTRKKLVREFDIHLENQIEATRNFYQRQSPKEKFDSPEEAVAALIPESISSQINTYRGKAERTPYNKPEEIVEIEPARPTIIDSNVFTSAEEWDFTTEEILRSENPDSPYVIHFDEFTENDENNEQVTLQYFLLDTTLVNERDSIIDNVEYTVGEDNLKRFGHGSHDSKVVYIRNPRLGSDFEVNLSTGSYNHEVLGNEDDVIKHSQRHPNRIVNTSTPRKFRGTDE